MTDVTKSALFRLIEKVVEDNISTNPFTLNEEVRQPFKLEIPSDLVRLAEIFHNAGHELYVVGGAVRDALLGKTPKDYDVATDAQPDTVMEMLSRFPEYKLLEIGKAFNKYEPTVKGQDLLDQGFKGRELGQELHRQEVELFKQLL
jgi:hypothetical protein